MRDALILTIITLCVLAAVAHPWIGILTWTAVSIMNFHRYSWGAAELPVAAAIAIAILIGCLFSRDRVRLIIAPPTIALFLFMVWLCITLPMSFYPDASLDMWKKAMKIDFMILVALALLHSRKHVMALTWTLVGALGFYGLKGGLFTLTTGGEFRVWGPPESFIEGNNELALALIMTIPLIRFLQQQLAAKWAKLALTGLMVLCAIAALGTQSRGAFLAIIAMAIMMWWRGGHRVLLGFVVVLIAWGLLAFMPEQWGARMSTISEYEQDASAVGRINAWWMAWNLARDRLFGGGFAIYEPDVFARYAPAPDDIHAAHSIYFQVLGEHGFIGLALFLLIWLLVWRSAGWLRRSARDDPQTRWAAELGAMCQASLAAYAVGGAFLSLAYFDLPYNLVVLIVVARRWVEERARQRELAPATTGPPLASDPVPASPPGRT